MVHRLDLQRRFSDSPYVYDKDGDEDGKFVFDATVENNIPLKYSTTDDILFYYPAGCFGADGVFTMPAAAADLADLGDKAPMAAKAAAGETASVTFKNVAAILKVGITGSRTLSQVQLSADQALGNDSSFFVSWDENDNPIMAIGEGAATSITINTDETLSANPSEFYFIIPAGIDLTSVRVTANFTTADALGLTVFCIDRGDWNVTHGQIYTMTFNADAGLFSGGKGTLTEPYIIANSKDFKRISLYCNNGYGDAEGFKATDFLAASYKQTADIDFNGSDISTYMIGGSETPFTGTYNGDNNTLSNFTISGTPSGNEGIAPFKAIKDAVLQKIAISNATINGGKFTAGLVGYAEGGGVTIQNCAISNSSISSNATYGVGGLIGGIYGGQLRLALLRILLSKIHLPATVISAASSAISTGP